MMAVEKLFLLLLAVALSSCSADSAPPPQSCVDENTCPEADRDESKEAIDVASVEDWGALAPDVEAGDYLVDLANVVGDAGRLQLNNVSAIMAKNVSYSCAYLTTPSLPPGFYDLKEFGKHVLVKWFPETSSKSILVVLNVETERIEVFVGRKPKKKLSKKKLKKMYKEKATKMLLSEKQFEGALLHFSDKLLSQLIRKGGVGDIIRTMAPMLVPVLVMVMFTMKGSSGDGSAGGFLGALIGKRGKDKYSRGGAQGQGRGGPPSRLPPGMRQRDPSRGFQGDLGRGRSRVSGDGRGRFNYDFDSD